MRGKVEAEPEILPEDGITPAYAGKRARSRISFRSSRDHPPPMRGKENACVTDAGNNGITPAYAGKSYGSTSFTLACEDHPRLCGEKF